IRSKGTKIYYLTQYINKQKGLIKYSSKIIIKIIMPYKKLYSKKLLLVNLCVYRCRAYIRHYKILRLKKLDLYI
ncbi:hypothetical protein V8F44DRAFT_505090, partial [Aspergillus fumigatus]